MNEHPDEAEAVKDLVFVFLDSEAEDPDGDREVSIVDRIGVRWVVGWDLVCVSWDRRYRPVRPRM